MFLCQQLPVVSVKKITNHMATRLIVISISRPGTTYGFTNGRKSLIGAPRFELRILIRHGMNRLPANPKRGPTDDPSLNDPSACNRQFSIGHTSG